MSSSSACPRKTSARRQHARDRSLHDGQPQVWRNPESGASGTVETKKAESIAAKPTTVSVAENRVDVDKLPIMDAVGEPYQVVSRKGANVRGGPGPPIRSSNR